MKIDAIILLGFLATILQFIAFYFSVRIYKFNRLNKWWLAIVFAFLIQAIRRSLQIYEDIQISNSEIFLDRVLMFIISLLMVVGLCAMMKNFENFEVVEKKVKNKIKGGKK